MSAGIARFESMFDMSLPDGPELRDADDASVLAAIGICARAEAAAAARRLAAIAELVARRADGPTDSARWSCDNWDAIAAEVAAAQGISHAMASGQMYLASALRQRLPGVGALLADGIITARLASAIVWHTDLITDPTTLALVDAALATDAARFGPLSVNKTAQAIDAIVARHDPVAVRRGRSEARSRELVINPSDGQSGTAALWGRLFATDAAVLEQRLTAMAGQVCAEDPRTLAQRRADALGALAAGGKHLACACGRTDCSAAGPDARAAAVLIHVIADPAALRTDPDPHTCGEHPTPDAEPQVPPAPRPPAAHLLGGATIPATMIAALIAAGAPVRTVGYPSDTAPEPGYRPSTALARFIRCRDMTCRFPGCDHPAEHADIDHTIPYPHGPTHPSNLKILCRKHHLLKTFWVGWRDQQRPDGTVVWTSPTGHTYTTRPGSRLLFPALCLPTGDLPTPDPTPDPTPADHPTRGLAMPTRRRTRTHDRAHRINTERNHNTQHITEAKAPAHAAPHTPPTPDYGDDPPPF